MGKRTNTATWIAARNRWQINVQKDGQRKTFTSSTPGRTGQREANAKADAWLSDSINPSSARVGEVLDDFLDKIKKTTSYSNWRKEKSNCENYIRPALANKKVASLSEYDLQAIIDGAYKKRGKNGNERVLSKKTLQCIRYTITSFVKHCRKKKLTTLIPELEIPKSARNKGKKILQPEDIKILFSVDTTVMYGKRVFDDFIFAYRFAVTTGFRPGELRGIRKENIVDDAIHTSRSINIYDEITEGKNENAVRCVKLSKMSLDILRSQLRLKPDSKYVFDISSTAYFRRRWQRYCEANGITVTTPYELRHTFVSIAKALPEGQVKQIVGHSRNMDTYGVYGHEMTGEAEKTAEDLNKIFDGLIK